MAHYALLNDEDVVINIINGIDETEVIDGVSPEIWYGNFHNMRCVRTSYNNNIRKRYAVIGGKYDRALDVFISPKPFPSWKLNKETTEWESPTPNPDPTGPYFWDEETVSWVEFTPLPE